MSLVIPQEVRVSVDIGCHHHRVAIGLSSGELLEEFDIAHTPPRASSISLLVFRFTKRTMGVR